MLEIVRYIRRELQNPDAEEHLAVEAGQCNEELLTFPYTTPAYHPLRPLKYEYRKIFTQKYLTFYWWTKKKAGNNCSRGLRETELLSAEPMTLSYI